MTGMHGGAGDPCAEIDLILRDCLEASQLQGNPNCFEEPTPAESDMYGVVFRAVELVLMRTCTYEFCFHFQP